MLVKGFEQQVRNTPDKLAIKAGEKSVSYDELNRSANRIAGVLNRAWSKDSSRSHTVGLLLDHGIDMIAALIQKLMDDPCGSLLIRPSDIFLSKDHRAKRNLRDQKATITHFVIFHRSSIQTVLGNK